jgi:CheY-like chemotaxis protein
MATAFSLTQPTAPATVLVIDDNEEDLKYWSDLLRRSSANYTVLESSSAAAGLDLCRARPVDCVVLDLDMPESGFHVLLELVPDRQRPAAPEFVRYGQAQWGSGVPTQAEYDGRRVGPNR